MDTHIRMKPTIVIVDDDPANLRHLGHVLKGSGWRAYVASNSEEALRQADTARPDIILLDVMMPGLDGFEICRHLKQDPLTQKIPVIFMTTLHETIDTPKGFEAGGVDYITTPFKPEELLARLRIHLELKHAREKLVVTNQELRAANRQLVAYQQQLEIAARTDPLTKLSNRRDSMERLFTEYSRARRYHHPLTIVLGDIDLFRQFNDAFGHACGDVMLRSVADLLHKAIRAQDHAGRWSGKKFLLMLPETNRTGAINIMERLRLTIANHAITYEDQTLSVTMTFGGHVVEQQDSDLDAALKFADQALYQGKSKGRNCIALL